MPPEDDQTTVTTTETTTGVPAGTDAGGGANEPAASTSTDTSTTTTGSEPTDMLSAVRAVLKPDPAEPSPAEGTGAGAPGTQPGDTPTGGDAGTTTTTSSTTTEPPRELTEADFADVDKPSVKKRIEKLLGERATVRAENETLREPATNWQSHVQFLVDNGISPQDAQNLYGVGAMLARGDWRNFVAAVEPYLNAAKAALGEGTLPEDLQRRVDEGTLSQEDASELSRTRAAAWDATRRATVSETTRTATADQARRTSVRDAMGQWEAGVMARDPDYARKRDAVTRYSLAMVAERGVPQDPATALQWANEALSEVNKLFTSARPNAPATPARPSSVAPQPLAQPEPKSLRQAVEMALARTRAA